MSAALKLVTSRETPLLFSGAMVCAILEGRKTQTRRLMKVQPSSGSGLELLELYERAGTPFWPGTHIWVKETHAVVFDCPALPCECEDGEAQPHRRVVYRATAQAGIDGYCKSFDDDSPAAWKPSIFMRRKDSRITLRVTDVRAERLQDITEEDAKAEGVGFHVGGPVKAFETLWDSINGDRAPWKSNPWVWVVGFRRVQP